MVYQLHDTAGRTGGPPDRMFGTACSGLLGRAGTTDAASPLHRPTVGAARSTGTRLPTVREASPHASGGQPTTVSRRGDPRAVGAIEARGRSARSSAVPDRAAAPRRTGHHRGPGHVALDLSTGVPDPALLPDLRRRRRRVGDAVLDHELPRPSGAAPPRGRVVASCRSHRRPSPSSTARWTPSTGSPTGGPAR